MKNFNSFTRLYPVSKTLRFELKPIGKTLEHIEQNGLLEQDKHRAESYQKVKELIDDYHKDFINKTLFEFSQKDTLMSKFDGMLEEFFILYQIKNKEDAQKKKFEEKQNKLRKMIVGFIKSDSRFSRIDKKELIKEDLLKFLANDENAALVNEFREFTAYFTGFHENRMNMYSEEAQSTAIAYRLIHENLPKFIDNMQTFLYVAASPVAEKFSEIYRSFEPYLNVSSIEEIFQLNYYKLVLTQTQIDVYNALIGGKTEEDGTKIQGLNEYINLFNQQQTDKHNRLPKFKTLFKQILSDRNRISWLPDAFSSDREVLASIEENYQRLQTTVFQSNEVSHSLKELMISLRDYDLERIWIKNDIQLTEISQKMFGNWNVIEKAIVEALKEEVKRNKKDTDETYLERRLKVYKSIDSFSIEEINHSLEKVGYNQRVEDYFANLGAVDTADKQTESLTAQITNAYTEVKTLLTTPYPEGKNLSQDKENVAKIKTLLDSFKALQHFVKPLLGKGDEAEKDGRFYGDFTALWDELGHITPIYNMVRNYLTRKPYSTEKIKLNFENSTLLNGWDLNKETDNSGVLLRKDGMYYLAIMAKGWNKVFTGALPDHGQCYEKIDYKLLPGPNKMLPKVFFSKSRMAEFSPSESLLEHYEQGTHKKGPQFNLSHCHELIDFFKSSIQKHSDWCQFGFQFSDTATYNDLNGFYQEVESQGYKISFRNVSVDYIDTLVDDGKLYLFQIYNKDFSTFSKGTPNMHTLYWKMLFDERNLKDVVYKLNGQAEVFYRKSSIVANAPTHPANKPIANKNPDNAKKESLFYYNLIKDRRYTIDKFMFHVPITMNFKAIGRDNINTQVNDFIRQTDDLHIIGIDRGERHLLYLCVIDMKGNIVEQYSLNDIVNEYNHNRYSTNYHELLERREGERTEARRSWKTIESIKELKEGYLSQVIHKIADLMVKYQAIVVLEDLNLGFKRGRQKVESSVYQQFEKQLIDKLNYLVDKKRQPMRQEGCCRPYSSPTISKVSKNSESKAASFSIFPPGTPARWIPSRVL